MATTAASVRRTDGINAGLGVPDGARLPALLKHAGCRLHRLARCHSSHVQRLLVAPAIWPSDFSATPECAVTATLRHRLKLHRRQTAAQPSPVHKERHAATATLVSHIARAAARVVDTSAHSAKLLKRSARYLLWLALIAPCIAHAQVDLSQLDAEMAAPRTQVLVLGSVHLSQLPKGSDIGAARLQPLMDRLAAYKPTIITVENLSGETCDLMRRHPAVYLPEDSATYCPDTSDAARATGLDVPAALGQVRAALGTLPSAPIPAQRRHLAALFLASGDPSSALVQWLQLAQAEQRSGDGLDAALVTRLRAMETRPNESDQIAARLAAKLGLQRVYPADDHTGDNVDLGDPVAYGKAIQAAWDKAAPRANAMREREDQLASEGKLLGSIARSTCRPVKSWPSQWIFARH